jgi:hypothetical protein
VLLRVAVIFKVMFFQVSERRNHIFIYYI